jgi:predicted Fe-S protein YdhL (DUF1289 family)
VTPRATDPGRCPLCGRDNKCGMVAGASTCWCFTALVPADVIERVPAESQGVTCVCPECAVGAVPSPCVGICELDAATGACRGCLRTLEEIAAWSHSSAVEKRAVLARIGRQGPCPRPGHSGVGNARDPA